MRYRIRHTTTYSYREPVAVSHNLVHLLPLDTARQRCLRHELTVSPSPATAHERRDYFGNRIGSFTVQTPHRELVVRAVSEVDTYASAPADPGATPAWEAGMAAVASGSTPNGMHSGMHGGMHGGTHGAARAAEFAYDSPLIPTSAELAAFAAPSFTPGRPLLEAACDLNRRIHRDFAFDATATSVATPVAEVLRRRRGVCQDFAQLAIGCLRSLGLAARYVSGYLETVPPAGSERLVGADASHAWFAIYCPDSGQREPWIDLDPTNDCLPDERHIAIAIGRDFGDVSPLKGMILGGGPHEVAVAVDVVPITGHALRSPG